jgi:hypothetical protein
MSTMGCSEFIDQLDAWLEGERHPDARAHVRDCGSCRSVAADLDDIRAAAPALMIADPEPPPHIWAALRAQLEEEGIIHDGVRVAPAKGLAGWLDAVFTAIPRPALAGAYLAFLIVVAVGLSGPFGLGTAPSPSFPLSAQLDSAEQTAFSSFSDTKSLVSTSLHENLAIVDNYITLCEKSVREEPDNEAAQDYLYQAYEQKADLIAQMTERGDSSR